VRWKKPKRLLLFLFLLGGVGSLAHAGRTINSVLIDDNTSVTVEGGDTVGVVIEVSTSGNGSNDNYDSTSYTLDGQTTCVDTSDHSSDGTYTESFNVTAPSSDGSYTISFYAHRNANCSNGNDSNNFVLSDAIIVSSGGRTINSVLLDDATAVTVGGGDSIDVDIEVTTSGSGSNDNYDSTSYTLDGQTTCVDTSNHNGDGTYTESFTITAPTADGSYDISFYAHRDGGCDPAGDSNNYVMSDAIIVSSNTGGGGDCPANSYAIYAAGEIDVKDNVYLNNGSSSNEIDKGKTNDNAIDLGANIVDPDISLPSLPAINFSSNDDRSLDDGDSLSPGNYDTVEVDDDATITMAPGVYTIDYFNIGKDARIVISPAGQVVINANQFDMDDDSRINDGGSAANLTVNFYSGDNFRLQDDVRFTGIIFSSFSSEKIDIKKDVVLTGGIFTEGDIKLDDDTVIIYTAAEQAAAADVLGCSTEPPAPVAEWRFDEAFWAGGSSTDVLDSSGNDLHGVSVNAQPAAGLICNAADFDRSNGIQVANNTLLQVGDNNADYTVNFWINPRSTNGNWTNILHKGNTNLERTFAVWFQPGNSRIHHRVSTASTWNDGHDTDAALDLNAWTMVTLVKQGNKLKTYLNGVLDIDSTLGSSSVGNTGTLYIGDDPWHEGIDGLMDELMIFNSALTASQIQDIQTNNLAGNGWDGSERSCGVQPVAEWRFDELSWSGSVTDSTGNGFDATALQTANGVANVGDGKICRAGSFPNIASNTSYAVATTLDIDADVGSSGAISLWYRGNTAWANDTNDRALWDASSDGSSDKYFYLTLLSGGRLQFGAEDSSDGDYRMVSSAQSVAADQWVNIVVNWDVSGTEQAEIWLDGTKLSTTVANDSMNAETLGDTWTLSIGDNRSDYYPSGSNRSANGDIDEVLVFNQVLDSAAINRHITYTNSGRNVDGSARICSGSVIDHYVINDTGSGVSCEPYVVTVSAVDGSGSAVDIPSGTVLTLSTDSANDGWSNPGGAGATYTLAADSASVEFTLRKLTPATLEIDVDDNAGVNDDDGNRDDDTVVFTDAGFFFYANGVSGAIGTQVSAKNSNLAPGSQTITIKAVKSSPADPAVCEALLSNTSADIGMAYRCDDPGSCASSNNALAINSTAVDASSVTPYKEVPLQFNAAGESAFTFNYSDAGKITLLADADLAVAGSGGTASVQGSSNSFLVKPAGLCVQVAESGSSCASGDASCSVFKKAGVDFNLKVSGRAWVNNTQSNTDFCNNAGVGNYIHAGIALNSSLVAPAGGSNAQLSVASVATDATGAVTQAVNVNEVGVFTFRATPPAYFTETIAASTSATIGRFIPDHFELTGGTVTAANTSTSSFTYLGQPVLLDYSLTARTANSPASTTKNYQGSFAKLDLDDVGTQLSDVGAASSDKDVAYGVLDTAALASYNNRLSVAGPGSATTWSEGVINVVGLPLTIERGASPEAPVSTVDVGLLVEDSDGVSLAVLDLDSDAAGAVDTKTLATLPGNLVYGRVFIPPVYGPEIPVGSSLDMPFTVQYFDGSAFVTHTGDSSTNYALWTASCTDADSGDGLVCAEAPMTMPAGSVVGGESDPAFVSTIGRPGLNNTGSLNITVTVDDWLSFDWDSAIAGDEYPSSLVTFGVYRGNDRVIYWRENHSP